jgi:hypothetical protein
MNTTEDIKWLDVAEVAKRVRAEIKAETGRSLPTLLKCRVRIDRFSMGRSLYVKVTAAPFNTMNAERVRFEMSHPHEYPRHSILSEQADALLARLDEIVSKYHWDYSDPASDYHNVNFFKHVDISSELQSADREERVEEIRGWPHAALLIAANEA